jgi:hypothetical protein
MGVYIFFQVYCEAELQFFLFTEIHGFMGGKFTALYELLRFIGCVFAFCLILCIIGSFFI